MASVMKEDKALAWAILKDLSDRAGIPEWLGEEHDTSARYVAESIAGLIARHRAGEAGE